MFANSESFASSSAWDSLLARHSRELAQEVTERLTALQVVDQVLERHAGSAEAWHSIQNLGVCYDDAICHNSFTVLGLPIRR